MHVAASTFVAYACILSYYYTIKFLIYVVIVTEVPNKDFMEGQTAVLSCEATGTPVPNITWLFNGHSNNLNSSNIIISPLNIVSKLCVNSMVTAYDVGTYTCVATNIVGSANSSGIITVKGTKYSYVNKLKVYNTK